MKIKVDDCFPDVTFFQLVGGNPKTLKSSEIFNKKKIILVSVPGAFTPTCSNEHLPGYVKLFEEFKKKGIDDIYFVSANDPFVMDAWINSYSESKVKYLADSKFELLEATGLEIDLAVAGLGKRLSRFAIFIDNGLIKNIFDEEGGGLEKSSAENLLKNL
ncbi:MAG: peroxiredoxin [Pelagibacteraceae bacterium TMED124]|nr:peroxiredoxin [Rickettsiales bacterium]RPG19506.1 MAG: peroxiredoxin [Pelagibacteraceae bacterium TMED124]|tara:strand:- start:1051 stop:1530 length:480 start_codon:yes stop_codon:yes gene_type:complete